MVQILCGMKASSWRAKSLLLPSAHSWSHPPLLLWVSAPRLCGDSSSATTCSDIFMCFDFDWYQSHLGGLHISLFPWEATRIWGTCFMLLAQLKASWPKTSPRPARSTSRRLSCSQGSIIDPALGSSAAFGCSSCPSMPVCQ